MAELFDILSVPGETASEEDRVVYLLASLPESYNVLVTAPEANENVPKLEVVTERILHQKRKSKDRSETSLTMEGAMFTCKYSKGKPKPKCHHCGRLGHIKRFCRDLRVEKEGQKERREKSGTSQKAATLVTQEDSDSDSIADHVLSASSLNEQCTWIIDSGATCRMCHDSKSFTTLYQL